MNKLIGIVLVNYNGSQDTIECIESIRKSQEINYKVIVVDNDSIQQDFDILSNRYISASDVFLYRNSENTGFSNANNIGTKIALEQGADYIVYLNNDTIVLPDSFKNLMKENDDKTVLTGKILFESQRDKIWYAGGKYMPWKGTTVHIGYNQDANNCTEKQQISFATGCYIFAPADILDKIGLWPEEYFLYAEDLAYSLNIIRGGYEIVYCPSSIIYHKVSRSTGNNSDLTNYYMIRNRFLIIRQYQRGIQKFSAYLYSLLACIKGIIKKKLKAGVVLNALKDFAKRQYGKQYKTTNRYHRKP